MDPDDLDIVCRKRGYHLAYEDRWCETCHKFVYEIRDCGFLKSNEPTIFCEEDTREYKKEYNPDEDDNIFDRVDGVGVRVGGLCLDDDSDDDDGLNVIKNDIVIMDDDSDDDDDNHYICINGGDHAYALDHNEWKCLMCGNGLFRY